MATVTAKHENFATTTRGLNREIPPMTLYEKAKRLGIWNPADIDFTQDKEDWKKLTDDQRDYLSYLTSQFQAGEEAVTLDLLPLIHVIASEGRIEEELFLTTFLFEEGKHVDFFNRFMNAVGITGDLTRYHNAPYREVFYEKLPERLHRLQHDPSRENMVWAAATYNLAVEGIMAETGYYTYFTIIDDLKILPGCRKGISLIKQDESRHIAYGIFLLSRLMAEEPSLWRIIEEVMGEMLVTAQSMITIAMTSYERNPFGYDVEQFNNYAALQCQKRLARIEKAKGQTLDEIYKATHDAMEEDGVAG